MLKGLPQERSHGTRRGPRRRELPHQGAEFPGIEPDAVRIAAVDQDRRFGARFRLPHLATAAGTTPTLLAGRLRRLPPECPRRELAPRFPGQEFELARVEPDTVAVWAPVDLDRLALHHDQRLTAGWTVHDPARSCRAEPVGILREPPSCGNRSAPCPACGIGIASPPPPAGRGPVREPPAPPSRSRHPRGASRRNRDR